MNKQQKDSQSKTGVEHGTRRPSEGLRAAASVRQLRLNTEVLDREQLGSDCRVQTPFPARAHTVTGSLIACNPG